MTEVIMPKMGDGMEEGTLIEWLKNEGDTVKSGEVIGTIQTDKATLELESPGSGKLAGIKIEPGQTVPVGTPIAVLLSGSEKLPSDWGTATTKSMPAEPVAAAVTAAVSAPESPATVDGERQKVSPLARKVAREAGIDVAALSGSGPGGRVVEKDVRAAMAGLPNKPKTIITAAAVQGDRRIELTNLRRVTAERTRQSMDQAPHFYVTVECDVEKIMALREFFKQEDSGKVSVNDFVVCACARALREMPEVNASFNGDHVLAHGAVNIGMAVSTDQGLTVAVIKNADTMTLREAGERSRELADRAHANKLSMDELTGATFTVSNMGMLDVDNFAAIIVTPNAGILAVSSARRKPVVTNDEEEIEVRWRMNVTGSFDHRTIDGSTGAKFVNLVRSYLENPTRLLS